ncbi:MAG TPA: CHASE4 domain-containing protein [Methanoregulaceae archaeon]|nr:CHASE4 domain-containing protein [Methanoregulaceae archaeon]HPJ74555.1 CHASE4 domain-containing protein [Methanoregulaceae archaeon]
MVLVFLLVVAGGFIAGMQFVMFPGLLKMEEEYAQTNLDRGLNAIENDAENLQILVKDWATWDDTYQYIQDRNERYIESNLVDDTFSNARLNFMVYFDSEGDVVFQRGFDFKEEGEEIEVPPRFVETLRTLQIAGNPDAVLETHKGLITMFESPVMIATAPILRSDDSGPARGTLVMARYFDQDEVERIGRQVSTAISLYPVDSTAVYEGLASPETLQDGESLTIAVSEDKSSISAITVIEDIGGNPAYAIRVDMDREAYGIGLESMVFSLFVVAIVGIISSVLLIIIVNKRFIFRLESLKSQVERIGKEQDFSGEVTLEGDDELTSLSSSFNRMLRALEEHIVEQRRAESRARTATEKLQLLSGITRHDLLNQMTVIQGNTDLLLSTEKNPAILVHLEKIQKAAENIDSLIIFTRDCEKMGISSPEWQNVEALVKAVFEKIQPSDIVVEVSVGDLEILADPLLERVFFNLVDNVLRHGQGATRISVTSHQRDDHMILVFEDDGCGVEADMKARLFEKGAGKNTGLGLFLSKEILRITGITISETGSPGQGARFELDIPPGSYRFFDKE